MERLDDYRLYHLRDFPNEATGCDVRALVEEVLELRVDLAEARSL